MTELRTIIFSAVISVFGSCLLTTAFIWLARTWISERLKSAIKHEYDEKLESHRAKLKAETDSSVEQLRSRLKSEADMATEQLKSRLQIAAAERQIQYSKVFEETATTIAEVYARLITFRDAVAHYTTPIEVDSTPHKSERRKVVWENWQQFETYFRQRAIYLPKSTVNQIREAGQKLAWAAQEFSRKVEGEQASGNKGDVDAWNKAATAVREEVQPLLEKLEDDFRGLLGTFGNQALGDRLTSSEG